VYMLYAYNMFCTTIQPLCNINRDNKLLYSFFMCVRKFHTGRLFYDDEDEDTGDDSIFKELDNVEETGTC